jgi:hypothetical protein
VSGLLPPTDRTSRLDSRTGPTAKALEDLEPQLTAVEVMLYQTKNQAREDPLNFPIMLNNKIAALQGVVESADGEPTEQSYDLFKVFFGQLAQQLNSLDSTVKMQLPVVNGMLRKQRLEPIKAEPLKTEEAKKR